MDIDGICEFIGCEPPVTLRGGKGKIKLKNLFKDHGHYYHEGKRAKELIDSLDMEVLIKGNVVPLKEIERILFEWIEVFSSEKLGSFSISIIFFKISKMS